LKHPVYIYAHTHIHKHAHTHAHTHTHSRPFTKHVCDIYHKPFAAVQLDVQVHSVPHFSEIKMAKQ
jgi:hypothetical protein